MSQQAMYSEIKEQNFVISCAFLTLIQRGIEPKNCVIESNTVFLI